ncbi:unnamed protein product [Diatraea saccharalis]|uniref:Rrn7/TAF1B C-terminal cyclin domain-containing protein n=1 Tax=Diatraea saccharalis TaxID=40085 RepID=A0A9N9WK01_9NEOP|nr:unnamed protein product [Diatraea saccharalis]
MYDKTNADPCSVCGGTDTKLVDGFYYCVECGTQDVNIRQTLIENKSLADGTFTIRQKRKLTTKIQENNKLSGEWHKWHSYNFILVGLADELIAAGAKPSFKMKVLWLWTEYIKKFQNKEELGLSIENQRNYSDVVEESHEETMKRKKKSKPLKMTKDLSVMKKTLLFSILYIALNLDDSEIQMSDLMRFLREGRLDLTNCKKYIPKEIKVKLVPGWATFNKSSYSDIEDAMLTSLSLLNCFNIAPRLPDLRKMVDKFIKELCLPADFKNLVLSLMQLVPCDYLEINISEMKSMLRLPSYECVVMSYVLVAFKMCFGLDDDYEYKVSGIVDRINQDNCYLKSYKLGSYSEPTGRLFSFKEWCNFIQVRKIILSKYYLHMAEGYLHDFDDYVYMEHTQQATQTKSTKLTDEIIMKLLERLPFKSEVKIIPKSEFKPTITPLSTYTELVMEYFNDPDLRLMFSEDFTQYSLMYAVENLYLQDTNGVRNILQGINERNKLIKPEIYGLLQSKTLNVEKVYVRNCDNKNWHITNQPKAEHVQKVKESNGNDKHSDHGYDSNTEIESSDTELNCKEISDEFTEDKLETKVTHELIIEENIDTNIFDEDFDEIMEQCKVEEVDEVLDHLDIQDSSIPNNSVTQNNGVNDNLYSDNIDVKDDESYWNEDPELSFNPNTFNRERTIRELVLASCKKYKIKIPKEYDTKQPKKRKPDFVKDKAGESSAKKPRISNPNRKYTKSSTVKDEVNELIAAYYKNLQHDVLFQLSEHVKSVVNNKDDTQESQNLMTVPGDETFDAVDDNEAHENIDKSVILDGNDSVQCVNEQDQDEEQNKEQTNEANNSDPKFNEKVYDIRQLYVKINDESDTDDPFDIIGDPVISEILDRKIEEIEKNKNSAKFIQQKPEINNDDSDDDIPLSILRDEKLTMNKPKANLELLVKKSTEIKEFNYWKRDYAANKLNKSHNLNDVFHQELDTNFPKSFYFVIRECALMLETTPYLLYKAMLNLENRLLAL